MKIKAGTPCFVSEKGENDKVYPAKAFYGCSVFTTDEDVEIKKNWKCSDEDLIAVVTRANSIETLVSHDEAQTIVWINKNYI
tara:strand:+ start:725 stop:970 length:246 start_codon:yes stop_codon:yes gene_type:complete